MKEERTRKETSKTLLWVLISGLAVITVSAIVASFLFANTDPLIALIENVTKLVSIAVGFYYWKAKNENLHKYKQDHKIGGTDYQGDYDEK